MIYFALETNTGAVNGFYTIKKDCIDTTEYLAERFAGSRWYVAESSSVVGNDDNEFSSMFHWKNEKMKAFLKHCFGDIENP